MPEDNGEQAEPALFGETRVVFAAPDQLPPDFFEEIMISAAAPEQMLRESSDEQDQRLSDSEVVVNANPHNQTATPPFLSAENTPLQAAASNPSTKLELFKTVVELKCLEHKYARTTESYAEFSESITQMQEELHGASKKLLKQYNKISRIGRTFQSIATIGRELLLERNRIREVLRQLGDPEGRAKERVTLLRRYDFVGFVRTDEHSQSPGTVLENPQNALSDSITFPKEWFRAYESKSPLRFWKEYQVEHSPPWNETWRMQDRHLVRLRYHHNSKKQSQEWRAKPLRSNPKALAYQPRRDSA